MTTPTIRTLTLDRDQHVTDSTGHFIAQGFPIIDEGIYLERDDVARHLRHLADQATSPEVTAALHDAANHLGHLG